jgi:hypothetical protein
MDRDFTLKIYELLLRTFQNKGYTCITYAEYCSFYNGREQEMEGARERGSDYSERSELNGEGITRKGEIDKINETLRHSVSAVNFKTEITNPKSQIPALSGVEGRNPKFVILRHDVDSLPLNSLRLARLEASLGIRGTYYFRSEPDGFNEDIIRQIAGLGHETGYHYETMAQVHTQTSGKPRWYSVLNPVLLFVTKKYYKPDKQIIHHAYLQFVKNLKKLRRIAPVSTVCMHGSPLSPFNNLDIWKAHDYRKLGISGEPYLDTDFSRVIYLTDTGRRWDGADFNVRDKTGREWMTERLKRGSDLSERSEGANNSEIRNPKSEIANTWPHAPSPMRYHRTRDIIRSISDGTFPDQAMITLHPQRWNDDRGPWMKELIWQNLKNQVKWLLIKIKG